MKRSSKIAISLAAAAAALLATGCSSMCAEPQEALVKCAGVNTCKGSSNCATPDNSCKGKNSCQHHGWSYMTRTDCVTAGGTVVD